MIPNNFLEEFKERMRISHASEDESIERMLEYSLSYVKSSCGEFDIDGNTDVDIRAKELVLERTRYAYNEALEYFEANFISEITAIGIHMLEGDTFETE